MSGADTAAIPTRVAVNLASSLRTYLLSPAAATASSLSTKALTQARHGIKNLFRQFGIGVLLEI